MKYILISLTVSFASFLDPSQLCALPSPTFRTVALRGQQAPGAANGVNFQFFYTPSINNSGEVAFTGILAQQSGVVTDANDSGIWSEGGGSLTVLAREGDLAPTNMVIPIYSDFGRILPNIGDSGELAWRDNGSAIWSGNVGNVKLIAFNGMENPGLPSGVNLASSFESPLINSQGHVAFRSRLSGTGVVTTNDMAVWSNTSGALTLVTREGDPAPGTPAGTNFVTLGNSKFNDAGQIALSANFSTIEPGALTESGFWSTNGGSLAVIARDFDPAPGGPAGAQFNIINGGDFSLNSSGQVAFRSDLRLSASAGVDGLNDQGIWTSGSGNLTLLAREGDQAPGTPTGAEFVFLSVPRLSNGGATAFVSELKVDSSLGINANNNSGLWSDASGNLSLIAREGDQAPGMPMGAVFSTLIGRIQSDFSLNSAGHMAFVTEVVGGGTTSSNNRGLWVQDAHGTLRLLLRRGDLLEVAPGDNRVVSFFEFSSHTGGGEGLARGFNDNYQLALYITFNDSSSGIFVTQLSVPEPGTVALVIFATISTFARRPRRSRFF